MNKNFLLIIYLLFGISYSAEVVLSFDQPAPKISGIGYDDGQLWVVSETTKMAYRLDPNTGDIIKSFDCELDTDHEVIGLGFGANTLWVGQNQHGKCFVDAYSTDGQEMLKIEHGNEMVIDISTLPAGIYFVSLTSENRKVFNKIYITRM